ncbi:MAG: dihydrofolate reductase family protein [Anaerolineae bacterium]|nr:dihydrofolate reductase family protein [Anaerolineae bacterium]
MGKVIVEAEVSLDGIMNGPEFWEQVFKYHSDDVRDYLDKLLFLADALLLGRMTYEVFAEVWPVREGKDAKHINGMPKYVASRTLTEPLAWNAALIKDDIPTAIGRLKQEPGKNLVQYGVGELTNTMLQHGLIDELHLLVFPFVFGKGPRVFEKIVTSNLKLLNTRTFSSGVVALSYQPDNNA